MRLRRILTLAVVVFCATTATAAAQKNQTTCGPDVHLRVTVTGTQGATIGMAYVSDGAGEYVSGVGRVEARFQVENCTHDFTMNLNRTARSMFALLPEVYGSHFFNFDRIHSVPITSNGDHFARWCAARVDPTIPAPTVKTTDGSYDYYEDNYADCGNDDPDQTNQSPQFNFVRRIASLNLDGDERLSFRGTIVNSPSYAREACQVDASSVTCATDFVKVYHPDPDTWIIKSEPPAVAAHFAWAGGKGYVFQGTEQVPLEITIKRR